MFLQPVLDFCCPPIYGKDKCQDFQQMSFGFLFITVICLLVYIYIVYKSSNKIKGIFSNIGLLIASYIYIGMYYILRILYGMCLK